MANVNTVPTDSASGALERARAQSESAFSLRHIRSAARRQPGNSTRFPPDRTVDFPDPGAESTMATTVTATNRTTRAMGCWLMSDVLGRRVRLQIHGNARGDGDAVLELAKELAASVRSDEPDVLTYRWNRAVDSTGWLIEEEYAHEAAFVEHMKRMRASGQMRRLGEVLHVDHVIVIAPDPELVGRFLGPLPRAAFERVEEL